MWTDFQNSFTNWFVRKFSMYTSQRFPPHLQYVATLPCESGKINCYWFCELNCWILVLLQFIWRPTKEVCSFIILSESTRTLRAYLSEEPRRQADNISKVMLHVLIALLRYKAVRQWVGTQKYAEIYSYNRISALPLHVSAGQRI